MSLLDKAKAKSVPKDRYPVCSVAKCDPEMVAMIDEALDHPETTDKGVSAALLDDHDLVIHYSTLGRHRRRDCQCD